ncbi:MAG TPA: hypothetical protein VH165_35630, partial [Kofleriaceae bacterium]|nr:hypothetical protein [Kofleriaceae bacterium]
MDRSLPIWERARAFYHPPESRETREPRELREPRAAAREPRAGDVILALGAEASAAAAVLADGTGRPVHVLAGELSGELAGELAGELPGELPGELAGEPPAPAQLAPYAAGARTVCVVATAARLGAATVAALQDALRDVRWGLITGRDAGGLAFVAAKQRLGAPRADAVHVLDALHAGDAPADAAAARATQHARLRCDAAAAWIIAAHGEGAHANLHELVLCGAPRAGELGPRGCRPGAEPPRCKRVHDPAVQVMSFAELRAAELIFLSCTGFSVAGQHHPSAASAVLSALEGTVRAVLTTDRAIEVEPGDAHRVAALRRAGVGLPALVELLNEAWRHELGIAPFLLVGDPARGGAEVPLARAALPGVLELGPAGHHARRTADRIWAVPRTSGSDGAAGGDAGEAVPE